MSHISTAIKQEFAEHRFFPFSINKQISVLTWISSFVNISLEFHYFLSDSSTKFRRTLAWEICWICPRWFNEITSTSSLYHSFVYRISTSRVNCALIESINCWSVFNEQNDCRYDSQNRVIEWRTLKFAKWFRVYSNPDTFRWITLCCTKLCCKSVDLVWFFVTRYFRNEAHQYCCCENSRLVHRPAIFPILYRSDLRITVVSHWQIRGKNNRDPRNNDEKLWVYVGQNSSLLQVIWWQYFYIHLLWLLCLVCS